MRKYHWLHFFFLIEIKEVFYINVFHRYLKASFPVYSYVDVNLKYANLFIPPFICLFFIN